MCVVGDWELAARADAPDLIGAAFARVEGGGAGLRREEFGDKLAGVKVRDMAGKPERGSAALEVLGSGRVAWIVGEFVQQQVCWDGSHSCYPFVVGLSVCCRQHCYYTTTQLVVKSLWQFFKISRNAAFGVDPPCVNNIKIHHNIKNASAFGNFFYFFSSSLASCLHSTTCVAKKVMARIRPLPI